MTKPAVFKKLTAEELGIPSTFRATDRVKFVPMKPDRIKKVKAGATGNRQEPLWMQVVAQLKNPDDTVIQPGEGRLVGPFATQVKAHNAHREMPRVQKELKIDAGTFEQRGKQVQRSVFTVNEVGVDLADGEAWFLEIYRDE